MPKQAVQPQPAAVQPATTPPPANVQVNQAPEATAPPTPSRNKLLLIVLPLIAIVALGIIAFFVVGILTEPAKVKEKASVNQPLFLDLERTNDKIATHITDETTGIDPDTIEREAKKGQDLLASSKKDTDELSTNEKSLTGNLSTYGTHLKKYVAKSIELSKIEEENVKALSGYKDPLKDYQKLTLDITGASNYIYTDPSKYVSALDSAISKEQSIINKFKSISLTGTIEEQNQALIKNLESEAAFLKEMRDAVAAKDVAQISSAQKTFTENSQELTKESNRLQDQLKNDVSSINDDLKTEAEAVKDEYNQLRTKYKF